jgi:hypothetical protein
VSSIALQSLPGGAHAFQDVLTTPTQRYHAIEGELRAGFYTDGRTRPRFTGSGQTHRTVLKRSM